jgi:hypothetical protein
VVLPYKKVAAKAAAPKRAVASRSAGVMAAAR